LYRKETNGGEMIMKITRLLIVLLLGTAVAAVGQEGPAEQIKDGAKQTGQAIKETAKTVGKKTKATAKAVGRKTKSTAQKVGRKTKEAAETVGEKSREAWRETKPDTSEPDGQ
jgi:hypothetical protein